MLVGFVWTSGFHVLMRVRIIQDDIEGLLGGSLDEKDFNDGQKGIKYFTNSAESHEHHFFVETTFESTGATSIRIFARSFWNEWFNKLFEKCENALAEPH